MKYLELLAPAKNAEIGKTAIAAGADAVYIGADRFGARNGAVNNLNSIEQLASYAHKYYAKIYVTINTLLHDHEIDDAVKLIYDLDRIGIDGIIVQDPALLVTELPKIPIIASTQMHNDNKEWVEFLASIGIKRVILARELMLGEIKDISNKVLRKYPEFEVEAFVHGAICVSYSGQCYLSYALGGRSGNRGECAQSCRNKYCSFDSSLKLPNYPLSLADMCQIDYIEEMVDAGVTSFKIEGRLKDENYVKTVVAAYRERLDSIIKKRKDLKRSSSGLTDFKGFTPHLKKVFNRSFTNYFLLSGKGDYPMTSNNSPKMIGEEIGIVKLCSGQLLILKEDCCVLLNNGDGLSYFDESGELCGVKVNRAESECLYLSKAVYIRPGTVIYRNSDALYEKMAGNIKFERKITVNVEARVDAYKIMAEARDEDGNRAEYHLDNEFGTARDTEKAEANVIAQLKKSGDTIFVVENVVLIKEVDEIAFVPLSKLNELRRALFAELLNVRVKNRLKKSGEIVKSSMTPPRLPDNYKTNILNERAADFYRQYFGANVEIEYAPESEKVDMSGKELMVLRYCPRKEFGFCGGRNKENAEPMNIKDEKGNVLLITFNCQACLASVFCLERK